MAVAKSINNDSPTAESIIRDLERLRGVSCAGCGARLDHHQVLMSIAMGFRDAPRCLPCLGAAWAREPAWLRDSLFVYIGQRQCYSDAWNWANRAAGLPEGVMPPALQSLPPSRSNPTPASGTLQSLPLHLQTDAEWDAGNMACGELVLELRLRLEAMSPGQLFKLCARDAGAPEDLPAWCRLTGHRLLRAEPPTYWIQRKE